MVEKSNQAVAPSATNGNPVKTRGKAAGRTARGIVPAGLVADPDKQRMMLADYIKLTAWWLGRPPLPKLPPRLEQVLRLLMQGASEKQIARKLGVSMHTVHDYAKDLHKRFGVSSRGELLQRFLPRG